MPQIPMQPFVPLNPVEALGLLQKWAGGGQFTIVPPATGGAAAPAAPTPAPIADSVFDDIPFADDGDVIRSNYHNSLRAAILALRDQGGGGGGPIAPLSPALLPVPGSSEWSVLPGLAFLQAPKTGPKASASGWLPVELPHGTTIQSLRVTGQRSGAIGAFTIILARQALTTEQQPPTNTIAAMDLASADATFTQAADAGAPDTPNASAAQIAERKLVDNTKYKYFITADVTGAPNGARAQINSFQVVALRVS